MANKVQARPDQLVSRRAAQEWSVLSLAELAECGLSRDLVLSRVEKGWLHPLYRGVYAVGHPRVRLQGRLLAAVKALGADAVASHFSAAVLWGFLEWDGRHPEVTVPRKGIGHRDGIRVHCSSTLERRDLMRHQGVPITSPPRTLVDLAAVVNGRVVRAAVRRALGLRRVGMRQLIGAARRLGPRRGSARLGHVLAAAAPTRSELEDVLLDLILDAGLPRPEVNRPLSLRGRRVIPDFRWPDERRGSRWHRLARQPHRAE
jgi:putative AbiEi antitoxin of type IV toxin-antitoxin system